MGDAQGSGNGQMAIFVQAVAMVVTLASAGLPAPADPARPIRDLAAALQSLPAPLTPQAAEAPIAAAFDLPAIALEALDRRPATAEQVARLGRIYARRIAREVVEAGDSPALEWTVVETRVLETGGWLVVTSARAAPDGEAEILQWRVHEAAEALLIADVLKDGTSFADQMRRQLARALQTRSLDGVLAALERRYGLAPP